jgi:hypothetical protein
MFHKFIKLPFILFILCSFYGQAQGIRGYVTDEKNKPLPFATIYIQQLETGTSSNADAYYELKIPPGEYIIYFKFIGYETQVKEITITKQFIQLNIALVPQVLLLNEVVTTAKATDPANWMIRRAIAKSSYNRQLIDSYEAKVYVKGKGRITDIPFYLRGSLEKEGIDTTTQFITESLSEVHFARPNQFSEKVISVYASKKTDFNANPMPYISSSFYQDEVAGAISPISSKAFQYYRFKHLGAFMDGGKLINKIRVIPKVKSPNVFSGEIQLVEDEWTLYNLNLNTQVEYGIIFNIKQVYQFVEEAAWMPITHQINISGGMMGIDFVFDYLASVSEYHIELNPALPRQLIINDEPTKKKVATQNVKENRNIKSMTDLIATDKEAVAISIDKLPEIMEEYERQQNDSINRLDIIGSYDFIYDSAAYSQDSTFWETIRPIPLSENEVRGYKKIDSISVVQEEENLADSTKEAKRGTFEIWDILTGGRYSLDSANKYQFRIYNSLLGAQFNTVDGLNFRYSIGLKRSLDSKTDGRLKNQVDYTFYKSPFLLIKPTFRYAFAREQFDAKVLLKYQFEKGSISLNTGKYISQFNKMPPLTELMNTSFTLLWEQNLMKIYDRNFTEVHFEKRFSSKLHMTADVGYEERFKLYNSAEYSFVDWERAFTPNLPVNTSPYDDFDGQKAVTAAFNIYYKPFVKYFLRNGVKQPVNLNSSEFSFGYYGGVPTLLDSKVNFSRVELGYKDQFDFGAKGMTFINAKIGGFITNKEVGFMDYAHFPGNRSFITQGDPVASYRLLDYYLYSTDANYFQGFLFHRFRKLLITQIPATRFLGLKEGVFTNYLYTKDSNNYTEFGYSLEGILKFFRVEVATQFENLEYKGWGIRIGVSTSLGGQLNIDTED